MKWIETACHVQLYREKESMSALLEQVKIANEKSRKNAHIVT
jgi:hypothetical protein